MLVSVFDDRWTRWWWHRLPWTSIVEMIRGQELCHEILHHYSTSPTCVLNAHSRNKYHVVLLIKLSADNLSFILFLEGLDAYDSSTGCT